MTQSIKRTNPADVANIFIRNLLCDISEMMGGFSEEDEKRTLKFFGGCCAYTGKKLSDKNMSFDHIVPHNRTDCGLHVYGNLVPADNTANKSKGAKPYDVFLLSDNDVLQNIDEKTRYERIAKIKLFQEQSGYLKKIACFGDLSEFAEQKYQDVKALTASTFNEIKPLIEQDGFQVNFQSVIANQEMQYEIDKILRKVPVWFSKPEQVNSRILMQFLQLTHSSGEILLSALKSKCTDIQNFDSNFTQMSTIAPKNHAKVFDLKGNVVTLWNPVAAFISEEYKKHCL